MVQLLALAISLSMHGPILQRPVRPHLVQQPSAPKWQSRAAFCKALSQVKTGWSKAKVKALLGPPDDISTAGYQGDIWRYGTNGHNTFPTLGQVQFEGVKAAYCLPFAGSPPSAALVTDAEMTAALRAMSFHDVEEKLWSGGDPLRLIRVANELIPMGQRKAMAVLGEYARYSFEGDQFWLFMLARTMFTSRKPGGVFPVPFIGAINPAAPSDMKRWPTYPLVMVDGIPLALVSGISIGGEPEPFLNYFKRCHADWNLRTTKLRPPDDPFKALAAEMGTARWRRRPIDKGYNGSKIEIESVIYGDLASLVRNCGSISAQRSTFVDAAVVEKLHQKFLKAGGHWDEAKQLYVGRDGAFTADRTIDYPDYTHAFKGIRDLDLMVTLHRRDRDSLDSQYAVGTYRITKSAKPAVVVLQDLTAGTELERYVIKSPMPYDSKAMIRRQGQKGKGALTGDWSYGSGFQVPPGHAVRVVVIDQGTKYISPVFQP